MANKKHVPKSQTYKFSVKLPVSRACPQLPKMGESDETALNVNIFPTNPLPNIPPAPDELTELIQKYKITNPKTQGSDDGLKTGVSPKKKKLNAFMAFRSYYTKFICNATSQRELSIRLAGLWKTYKHQKVWQRYCAQYNSTDRIESFFDWLQRKTFLDIKSPNKETIVHRNNDWAFSSQRTCLVEDVYYDIPQRNIQFKPVSESFLSSDVEPFAETPDSLLNWDIENFQLPICDLDIESSFLETLFENPGSLENPIFNHLNIDNSIVPYYNTYITNSSTSTDLFVDTHTNSLFEFIPDPTIYKA
ncbi:hypothetical protein BABINDRAFT_195843 [Babjeviella inositovora NRRL Y-12698]|uniref:Alpha box domain-containing protein n=1 Tax=Babjeviella inositovora NRRL Y-12698 TaxID=984486 RepID=A0A1E3QS05_9ASCO|nr:uncharacterized protein BABINDRAFT_195843 [Babjeviella inositovora NRRL Y-12698]ODQ80461.1 hypothetical protein BABINDRAFT_195843 [Babjeviella inositovora NRRL Y-12698]